VLVPLHCPLNPLVEIQSLVPSSGPEPHRKNQRILRASAQNPQNHNFDYEAFDNFREFSTINLMEFGSETIEIQRP